MLSMASGVAMVKREAGLWLRLRTGMRPGSTSSTHGRSTGTFITLKRPAVTTSETAPRSPGC
jgi:hypothetical protein